MLIMLCGCITLNNDHQYQIPDILSYNDSVCHSYGGLPDSNCTPGSVNESITQYNIQETICVSGYTDKVRPSTDYTNLLKEQSIKDYGYLDTNMSHYEFDHLIPLSIGGHPTYGNNLWAEYGDIPNDKDAVENRCHRMVCNGEITLKQAQQEIASDWRIACR